MTTSHPIWLDRVQDQVAAIVPFCADVVKNQTSPGSSAPVDKGLPSVEPATTDAAAVVSTHESSTVKPKGR
jgi:hypothetical protein